MATTFEDSAAGGAHGDAAHPPAPGAQGEPGRSQTRVLLVEDDPVSRRLVHAALPAGYSVAFAGDGDAGVGAATSRPFDLVLMDIGLPGIDGIEATRRIHERLGGDAPPVVMLTAHHETERVDAALAAGAVDYITKPFTLPELLRRVQTAVERKRARDVLVQAKNELASKVEAGADSLMRARGDLDVKIRELGETQARLEASIDHLDGILSSVIDGIITIDEDGRIVSFNRSAEAMFGYAQHEVVGRNVGMLMPEPNRGAHDRHLRRYVATGRGHVIGSGPREVEALRRDGSVFPADLALSEMRVGGRRLFVGVMRDITERRRNAERLTHLANFDAVTGLPNRNLFLDRLGHAMQQAQRNDRLLAVFFMDLDGFKRVNDTLGHHVGDDLLRGAAARLKEVVRRSDTVARMGGDEFTVIVEGLQHVDPVYDLAQKIVDAMRRPFTLQGYEVVVSISIGATIYPFDTEDLGELLKNADAAMYKAKEEGRNRYAFYTQGQNAKELERLTMEIDVRRAAERGDIVLHYQPQLELGTGRIVAVEALARWKHAERGQVSPEEFVPVLESSGLIIPVGGALFREAVGQSLAWAAEGVGDLRVSINLSPRQFDDPGLVQSVRRILQETGASGSALELEITEGTVMRNVAESAAKLRELHDMGISIAIDDFGTGYSSLSYLRHFHIDTLKIDRSFVRDIARRNDALSIATTIIAMARALGMRAVAEGVESEEQVAVLAAQGCDVIQGYYVSPARPAAELAALLAKRRRPAQD